MSVVADLLLGNLSEAIFNCFFLVTESLCLLFKIFFLFFLYKKTSSLTRNKTYFYLVVLLLTGIFTNITLILYHLNCPPFLIVSKYIIKTFFRLENATLATQFFVLLCFARRLSSSQLSKKILHPFHIFTIFFVFFSLNWGSYTFLTSDVSFPQIGRIVLSIGLGGFILFEGLCTLLVLYRNYKIEPLKLLKHHNFILGWYFILPYLIIKVFEADFIFVMVNPPAAAITSIIFTGIIYYCYRKLVGLRFLNMQSHVEARPSEKFIFIDEFKNVLDRLGKVRTVKDLDKITKDFFYKAFEIPEEKVSIIFKDSWLNRQNIKVEDLPESPKTLYIERSFNPRTNYPEVILFANENKIMMRDEIEFTDFHSRSVRRSKGYDLLPVVHFLKAIDVDIFIPIYCEDKIVAYLLVDHSARPNRFYTDVERDEMLIYISHLGGIIYLLSHLNLESLLAKDRITRAEVYKKDRKMDVLTKGLYSFFFASSRTRKIGVLAYKNKKFGYGNEEARDMLKPIDLNKDKGDDLTKTITDISQESATFFSHKKAVTDDSPSGEKILISASPNLIKNNTLITISAPHLNDLICDKLQVLKDQTKWDYLVALETSDEGKIINQLLPANTPTILNSKISFFEQAVTSKVVFLEMSSTEDVLSFAYGIHKINERKEFEEVFAGEAVNDEELGLRFFGINPIYQKKEEKCLLKKLDKKGTLLIQNLHLLSLKLQGKLLEFIDTGRYSPLYSEDSIKSDVILVCATNQNLLDLVSQGIFSKELYLALHKSSIWLPSLNNLSEEEFLDLAEGLRKQLVASKIYKNLMVFNDSDRRKLLDSKCVSIDELKSKIQGIITKKTQKQQSISNPIIDPAYKVSDLELMEAVRLGKYALKDPKMLAMLLRKFNGNQSRVAMFLGVNRSTINRRCVQFGLDALIKKEPLHPGSSDKKPSDEDLSLGDPIDKELTFDEEETTKEEN